MEPFESEQATGAKPAAFCDDLADWDGFQHFGLAGEAQRYCGGGFCRLPRWGFEIFEAVAGGSHL